MRIALLIASIAVLHAQPHDWEIVRKADDLLSSEAVWNRHDTRECPAAAKTLSLYCALERAIVESGRAFEHRDAVMEQVRIAVDLASPHSYEHRLMEYNNDPDVSFVDLKRVLRLSRLRMAPPTQNATSIVRGRLLQNGSPVPAATVAIYCRDRTLPSRTEMTALTAKDGSFQFHEVPGLQGWYVYAKMASIHPRGAALPRVVLTFPNETTVLRDLEITPAYQLGGKVVLDDGGRLPEGSRITLAAGCLGDCTPYDVPDSQRATLRSDGAFSFEGVRGPVRLAVWVPGYGLHVDSPDGKPPGSDNYNRRILQLTNQVPFTVSGPSANLTIVLEPRPAPPRK